jgi:hypothetical protein
MCRSHNPQRPNVCCLTILNTSKPPLPADTLYERSSTWAGHKASSSFPNKVTCSVQVDTFRNLRYRILNNTWPFSKSVHAAFHACASSTLLCDWRMFTNTSSQWIGIYLSIWRFYQIISAVNAYPSKNSSAFTGHSLDYCNSGKVLCCPYASIRIKPWRRMRPKRYCCMSTSGVHQFSVSLEATSQF